jgi:hypothetical protein
MNQEEFLQQLARELAPLNEEERGRVIDYYREMICDGIENGEDEQKMIESFGKPYDIAAQILAESRSTVQAAIPSEEENTYTAKNPVQSIIIDARQIALEIRPVPSGPVEVHFMPAENDRVSISEQDGIFTFRQTVLYAIFHWHIFFSREQHKIVLDIPESFHGALSASTSNARIGASGLGKLSHVRLESSNGQISLSNFECGTLNAKTSNGAVIIHNLYGSNCTVQTSNGRISAESCTFPDGLTLRTCNSGMFVQSVSSDQYDFASSNGSIRGTVFGDMREYAVRSHTSNGSSTLPPELVYPDQKKSMNVHTSNARIDIRFLQQST